MFGPAWSRGYGGGMASIFPRNGFYYLKFKTELGDWHRKKLPIRLEDPDAQRKCAMAVAAEQVREAAMLPSGPNKQRGWGWVPGFLETHYTNALTRVRARNAWAPFAVFLEARQITEPALVTFAHGHEYVAWRLNPPAGAGVKARKKNTAILELKFAGRVMAHAVRLGLALANPLYRLGIRKEKAKEKVEITAEEQARIEAALADQPGWMRDAWDVAMKQGCRLRHATTRMQDIDEQEMTIFLCEQKGKRHLAPLHPDLLPLVQRRRADGAERLVEMPEVTAPRWRRFFNKLGMPQHCFHDTRVTVITRLARAGVSEPQTKAFVGHASSAVHAIYTKLKAPDVAHVQKFL